MPANFKTPECQAQEASTQSQASFLRQFQGCKSKTYMAAATIVSCGGSNAALAGHAGMMVTRETMGLPG